MDAERMELLSINGRTFEIVKPTRLLNGMVLKAGDIYARVGEKKPTLEEQNHTVSLLDRGFPVPIVLESGELPDNKWYFTETSLGQDNFHKQFTDQYRSEGEISEESFARYLAVIKKYARAQSNTKNRTTIKPSKFIETLIPKTAVLPTYCYFGHSETEYVHALDKVADRLVHAPMGIIQHDLNPFNILDGGVIDFELVGYGPIGYDTLMSARWSQGWFTNYPSRYPTAYKFSSLQIQTSDELIDEIATTNGCGMPTEYLQEFTLLKSAWAISEIVPPDPDWPHDKLAFRRYRANVLAHVVQKYLDDEEIDFTGLANIPGGELIH
jgi:hypothetical protein